MKDSTDKDIKEEDTNAEVNIYVVISFRNDPTRTATGHITFSNYDRSNCSSPSTYSETHSYKSSDLKSNNSASCSNIDEHGVQSVEFIARPPLFTSNSDPGVYNHLNGEFFDDFDNGGGFV